MKRSVFTASLLIAVFGPFCAAAQISGCTDARASNFNPDAGINDGSCSYPVTKARFEVIVKELPEAVEETSGLIFWNGGLWTHNDSFNDPVLSKLDTLSGMVMQTITLSGAENFDWEDIAQDENFIYIGDFGNNLGNRKNLVIYKINKKDIPETGDVSVPAEVIRFGYADQTGFEKANRNNDYDCEAMISAGDSLFLFSKNWVNQKTRMYAVPKIPGEYLVHPLAEMDTDGMVTGADINEKGELVFIGYKNYQPFVWLLFDYPGTNFFSGNKRRITLPGTKGLQTEGICHKTHGHLWITAERTPVGPARLYSMYAGAWLSAPGLDTVEDVAVMAEPALIVFPDPADDTFVVHLEAPCPQPLLTAEVYAMDGRLIQSDRYEVHDCCIRLAAGGLGYGLFQVKLFADGASIASRLLINGFNKQP